MFCLYLDAKSAFDRALREILTRRMYLDGTGGHSLLYLDERLGNRVTFIEWEKTLMGPIHDQQGVEQGGPNSSEEYKIYNNEQLDTAQDSKFGVRIGTMTVSCVGQADDSVLLSHDIHQLGHLLHLTTQYCHKYKVEMTPEKTKLQVFAPPSLQLETSYSKAVNYLSLNGVPLQFTDITEHDSNMPHILQRISSHKRTLDAVLSAGMSRNHRGNPAASIKAEKVYALPVLLSGLGCLFLLESEVNVLSQHYKDVLEALQKLHTRTPEPVVFFLAGSLPFRGYLHLRQLTIFSMICRLQNNILHKIAQYVLTRLPDSAKSWFIQIKKLCFQYSLPHPLQLLAQPPEKQELKKLINLKVQDFWQLKLRQEAAKLENNSLKYFNPNFMSLSQPHHLWLSCGNDRYQLNKACQQAKYLSGRSRTEKLCSYFSKENSPFCQLHPETETVGDLLHHLVLCPVLDPQREELFEFWNKLSAPSPVCAKILLDAKTTKPEDFLQFLLDCSSVPLVVRAANEHGSHIYELLFKATRTFCYTLYRAKRQKLDQWTG